MSPLTSSSVSAEGVPDRAACARPLVRLTLMLWENWQVPRPLYPFFLCKAILMGLRKQLRQDGHITAGACGFTTWTETMENLSDAYVCRVENRIMAISEDAGAESEWRYGDVPHGSGAVCYTATPGEKPIRDAMSGQTLGSRLVAIARQKGLTYFLATEVWLKRPRSEAYRVTGKRPFSVK